MKPKDLHREKAAEIFNVKVEDVTEAQRRFAKTLNFALHYGFLSPSHWNKVP